MQSCKATPESPSNVTVILKLSFIDKSIKKSDGFSNNASSSERLTFSLNVIAFIKRGTQCVPHYLIFHINNCANIVFFL